MKMLVAKLMEIKERENLEKISDIKASRSEITWGSQIRSYVFMPYTMVKDHPPGYETGNVNAVMDGDYGRLHQRLPHRPEPGHLGGRTSNKPAC